MKFDYSAFDIDQIISVIQNNNVSLSFEKIENLQKALEDMLPMMISVKARSKKYFNPLVRMIKYDSLSGKLQSISNYNSYSDAGVMFDEKNKEDIENISQFLNSYLSLQKTYFFDVSNVFGTCINSDEKHILYSEYNINYIPLKVFRYEELQKFINYMPLLEQCGMENIQSCDLGISNFVIDVDGNPKKLEFVVSKNEILKLKIFDSYEKYEEIRKIIFSNQCGEECKIGFYFVGKEQNKVSLLFNIFDKNIIETNVTLQENTTNILYELCWDTEKISEITISQLETPEDQGG